MMNKRRKVVVLCSVGMMAVFTFGTSVNAMDRMDCNTVQKITEIEPREETLTWIYKTVNGIRYKRLWNTVTNEWVSDWIKC